MLLIVCPLAVLLLLLFEVGLPRPILNENDPITIPLRSCLHLIPTIVKARITLVTTIRNSKI